MNWVRDHHSSATNPRRSNGFTLIELLLGIAIMATVIVAINAVFFTTQRLRERTISAVEESLPIQQTMATMRRDLQGIVPPTAGGLITGTFKAGNVTSLGVSMPVDIEFNTTTGIVRDDQPWSEVQKVSYGLRMGGNRQVPGSDLYRTITRNLLATITPQPEEQWLLSGVESLQFSCYDGQQWRDFWDTSVMDTNLPSAIRMRITLASHDGQSDPRQLEMVVPISSQVRSNQVAAGSTQ
ncbi:MAG TPA: GspJ family type II secretion system protein [Verrucomicrobiae bacterium]|nr:GspJ family type II secretion system protein [Verrucomicrobiae bacterium]